MKILSNIFKFFDRMVERKPAYLIKLYTSADAFYYCAADRDVTYNGQKWQRAAISVTTPVYDSNLSTDKLSVTFETGDDARNGELEAFLLSDSVPALFIDIYRTNLHDPVSAVLDQITRRVFTGRIERLASSGRIVTCDVVSWLYVLRNNALRVTSRATCNHRTYSTGCGVVEADFTVTGIVTAIDTSAATITLAEVGVGQLTPGGATITNGYFSYGYVKFGDQAVDIVTHDGTTLSLLKNIRGLEEGVSEVMVVAGDDFSAATCRDKFNNINRFLGMPYIPQRNPVVDSLG